MTLFRPCIDIHDNKVKQIVGSTLRDRPEPKPISDADAGTETGAEAESQSTSDNNAATDDDADEPTTNFISDHTPGHFASLYRQHDLTGAHVIMLGPGNTSAALDACAQWPYALQVGGGIDPAKAAWWLGPEGKAGKVIVTSYIFPTGDASSSSSSSSSSVDFERLGEVFDAVGRDREKLVIDLSCVWATKEDGREGWFVATKKWTVVTDFEVNLESLCLLAPYCSEFLIHSVGVEGLQSGIDTRLVAALGDWAATIPQVLSAAGPDGTDISLDVDAPTTSADEPTETETDAPSADPAVSTAQQPQASRRTHIIRDTIAQNPSFGGACLKPFPVTYAGGATSVADLELVRRISNGRVDLTIGSALDIFGGKGVTLDECVAWNRDQDLL